MKMKLNFMRSGWQKTAWAMIFVVVIVMIISG